MNAKELALSKLNATTKTLGLYIYGLSIGVPIETLANIMMSDTGQVISDMLEGNVFTGKASFNSLDLVFNYFKKGPREISKYNKTVDSLGHPRATSPYKIAKEIFVRLFGLKDNVYFEKSLAQILGSLKPKLQKLGFIEALNNAKNDSAYKTLDANGRQEYDLLVNILETFTKLCITISSNLLTYLDIQTLSKGASELRLVGLLFGLNKGLKTKPDEILSSIHAFTRCIYNEVSKLPNITSLQLKASIINIEQFVIDGNYRLKIIKDYEKYKTAFNIVEALANDEHFMGYLKTEAIQNGANKLSFRYRSIENLTLPIMERLNIYQELAVTKGLNNYLSDKIRRDWMLNEGLVVIVPKGNVAYDVNLKPYILNEDTPIVLGTKHGEATFRTWMENEVIPNMLEGRFVNGEIGSFHNKFIDDLGFGQNNRTISHNPLIVYTLPINMMPLSDLEKAIFDSYKAEFNKLSKIAYSYQTDKGALQLPVIDLFTYYAMIAHGWNRSESSLQPILTDFENSGKIDKFHQYEIMLDNSGQTLLLDRDILLEELIPYLAAIENPYTSYSLYIYMKDSITRKYALAKRNEKLLSNKKLTIPDEDFEDIMLDEFIDEFSDEMADEFSNEDFDEDFAMILGKGNYTFISSTLNSNIFADTTITLNDKQYKVIELSSGNILYYNNHVEFINIPGFTYELNLKLKDALNNSRILDEKDLLTRLDAIEGMIEELKNCG